MSTKQNIVVIGDVHHHIAQAAEALTRLEQDIRIDQVFSVGDLGLFLTEPDWAYLTGPSKYRKPEESHKIRKAWEKWKWPVSIIAGNHEPFNRLRNFDPGYFSFKLSYANAGILEHNVPDLLATGISGIYKPTELDFMSDLEARQLKIQKPATWEEMVLLVEQHKISRSRLTYYKESDIEHVKSIKSPNLMLLHDWPIKPRHTNFEYDRRPEKEIVEKATPQILCCGHHHTAARFTVGTTEVFALNIIGEAGKPHMLNKGWAMVAEWNGAQLNNARHWPEI